MNTHQHRDPHLKFSSWERLVFCALLAVTAGLGTQYASPLFNNCIHFDHNIYHTIGREIISGSVPYRDLVDHKGPILHFIFALAALLSPSPESFTGVMYLQIISYFITFFFTERTARLFFNGILPQLMAVSFGVVVIEDAYQAQAVAFTYPLHIASLYFFVKHLKNQTIPPPLIWFIWGICFAFALLIKIPYAIAWGFAPAYWLFSWFQKHSERMVLWKGGAALFLGVVIPQAAVAGYFLTNGALDEFIYWYIEFNFLYYPETDPTSIMREHVILAYFDFPVLILAYLGAILLPKSLPDFSSKAHYLGSFAFAYIAMVLPGRCSFIQCMAPFATFGFISLAQTFHVNIRCNRAFGYSLCAILTACLIWNMGYLQRRIDGIGPNPLRDRNIKGLSKSYLDSYKNDLALGKLNGSLFSPMAPFFYRISGLRIADKFFFPPAVSSERFPGFMNAFAQTISEGKPDWIILPKDYEKYSWTGRLDDKYILVRKTRDSEHLLFGRRSN